MLVGCTIQQPDTDLHQESTSGSDSTTANLIQTVTDFTAELAQLSDPDTRCARTSRGNMLETKNGYYLIYNSILFYADKSDLTLWVPVCAKPDCAHDDFNCYAVDIDAIWLAGDRLYGATDATKGEIKELGLDGSIQEVVYTEPFLDSSSGKIITSASRWDSYCLLTTFLETDGTWTNSILLMQGDSSRVLFSKSYPEQTSMDLFAAVSNTRSSIRGDYVFCSRILLDGAEDTDVEDWISRDNDRYYQVCADTIREITPRVTSDIYGAYIEADSLYHFHPNDGFYYMDLSTGQEAKVADAAYADSYGYSIDGCLMVEMTMGVPGIASTADQARLRYFDGKDWHEVKIPETWQGAYEFNLIAATSDRIFFTVRNTDVSNSETTTTLYSVMLGEDEVVPCNAFPSFIELKETTTYP